MQAVERALDVALIVVRNGGSTGMADRAFRNVLKGYNQDGVSVAWRLDFVAASSVADGPTTAVLRPVGSMGVNLFRAAEAVALGERVARGEIDEVALVAEIDRINALDQPYNRWIMTAAAACAGAAFARLIGGDWGAAAIALAAAGAGRFVRSLAPIIKLPVVPGNLACGVLSACLAGVGLRLGLSQMAPAALTASVVYLIPGLPLINGFADMITHRHLFMGLGRIANAALTLMVLAVAIAFAYAVVI